MATNRIHLVEKAFLWLGALLLGLCLLGLLYASAAMGLQLPTRSGEVDPERLGETPPFDSPGVRQVGEGGYEVVMIGRIWSFVPGEVRVPAGAEVTFLMTSADVLHGFHVDGTRLNVMLVPGQVTRAAYRFEEPGRYVAMCHEYCGAGHHNMFGTIVVE